MNNLVKYSFLTLLAVVIFCGTANGQFTIKPQKEESEMAPLRLLEIHPTTIDKKFFDKAANDAEKKRIRRERNTIEFSPTFETSIQQLQHWDAASGNNAYSALATAFFKHRYQKDKYSVEYQFEGKYGMNFIDSLFYKNQDYFKTTLLMGWKIHNNWSYSGTVKFESQFTTSYKSATDSTVISRFMAPGKLNVAVGFEYSQSKSPFRIIISPLSGNIVAVFDKKLSEEGKHGVAKGEKIKGALGPSLQVWFDRSFGKKKNYRYRSDVSVFTPYKHMEDPIINWNNNFTIQLSRYLSTTFTSKLLFDKAEKTDLQYQFSLTLGLRYNYKNK